MRIALLSLAGLFVSVAAPAVAQTQISCPLTTANRTISDTVPAGWSKVPYAQRLTNTRITESGVLQTLICEYGEAGQVQRAAPADTKCTARNGGFTCTGTVMSVQTKPSVIFTPQRVVYRSGTITLERSSPGATYHLDFDAAGTQNTTTYSGSADINHIMHSDRGWRFELGSGSKVWLPGRDTENGYDRCTASESSFQSTLYSVVLPPAGRYVCYKTNGGRFGEFTIVSHSETPGGLPTVTIRYWTW